MNTPPTPPENRERIPLVDEVDAGTGNARVREDGANLSAANIEHGDDDAANQAESVESRNSALQQTAQRTWKRNERLVYATNFAHMAMMTMCMGGVWDIFLYNFSQDSLLLIGNDPLTIGHGAALQPPLHMSTYDAFEMTFDIKPSRHRAPSKYSNCSHTYTCATSVIHITAGKGNGDCCQIGDRIPAIFFMNGTTQLLLAMDVDGYNHSDDVRAYDQGQSCFADQELPVEEWSSIKVKDCSGVQAKGEYKGSGGLAIFVNGQKACEIDRAKRGLLPSFSNASVFFGALQAPQFKDRHNPANAEIRNLKYSKPASNTFVGLAMSTQGVCSVLVMYPIGWLGDRTNRYHFVRWNMLIGFVAAASLATGVLLQDGRSLSLIFGGIIAVSAYQQGLSALIYAILADNVVRGERARASTNYKTLTALAMSLGPAIQLLVVVFVESGDGWSPTVFRLMLIPGWLLLPAVTSLVFCMTTVGKKRSALPSADDMPRVATSSRSLSQEWLDQRVFRSVQRRYAVAFSAQAFFIGTLLANGMTVRYFSLYFTEILKFSPAKLCLLNAVCRLWIAVFVQLVSPLTARLGRVKFCLILHLGSALFTAGIYGAGLAKPGIWVACICYLMRFAFLHARDPLLYSMTMDVVPESQRSRWAALNSLRTLSFSASALLGGFLSDRYGYQFSFQVTVYALLSCTVLFLPAWLWFPKHEGEAPAPDSSARTAVQQISSRISLGALSWRDRLLPDPCRSP